MFNYELPVKVFQYEMQKQMEEEILKAVQKVGVEVDKEELLKALKYDREQYEKGYRDGSNANKWIPCSERLPECEWGYETEAVLFQLESGLIEVGYYGTGGKYRDRYFRPYRDHMDGFDAKHVIAWQPLPEPYDMRKKVTE